MIKYSLIQDYKNKHNNERVKKVDTLEQRVASLEKDMASIKKRLSILEKSQNRGNK